MVEDKRQIVGEFLKWWSDEILFKKSVIPSTWVSMMACLPTLTCRKPGSKPSMEKFCMVAFVFEFGDYALGDFSVVGCFEEFAVWGTFAFGLDAVAVVD